MIETSDIIPKDAKYLYDIMEFRARSSVMRGNSPLLYLRIMVRLRQIYGPEITVPWLACVSNN